MHLFWNMPGPTRFLQRFRDETAQGKSVVVRCPRVGLSNAGEAIRDYLRDCDHSCDLVEPTDGELPLQLLLRLVSFNACGLPTIDALLNSCERGGRVFIIEGLKPMNWPAWKNFLATLNHRVRQRPAESRPILIAVLRGPGFEDGLSEDVALSLRDSDGVVSQTDALCLADLLYRPGGSALVRRIVVSAIAGLAMWDYELLRYLAGLPPSTILEPMTALKTYAHQKGWTETTPENVWEGTSGRFEGRSLLSPALSALREDQQTIQRILWRAQVGVLLPWVEEERLLFVDGLRLGKDLDLEMMETGELWAECCNHPIVSRNQKDRLATLRYIRNELAHRRCLSAQQILSGRFRF